MNKYVKEFLHRGMMFGGFGPIILGIIYWIVSEVHGELELSGFEIFLSIVSIYLLLIRLSIGRSRNRCCAIFQRFLRLIRFATSATRGFLLNPR